MASVAVDRAVADLASAQWGLVTTAQAAAVGVSRAQLARLADSGPLTRISHGIYAVRATAGAEHLDLRAAWLVLEPARTAEDRLADGPDGVVVSHASAAALSGLGDVEADVHEFTLASRKQSRRSDLRLHRAVLDASDITIVAGLPVTTVERTVLDLLSDNHDGQHVAGVLASAMQSEDVDLDSLGDRLDSFSDRFGLGPNQGRKLVRHLLDLGGASEQVLARDLIRLLRAEGLSVEELADAVLTRTVSAAVSNRLRHLVHRSVDEA